MALTDDQRALLRLFAQSEESYEDIAALKGVSVAQVKSEVRAALTEATSEAPAEPAPPEPVVEKPKVAAEQPAASAEKPAAPATPKERPAPAKPSPRRPGSGVPPERRRLLVFVAGAMAAVAVVLIAIAVFGEDSDSGSGTGEGDAAALEAAGAEAGAGQLTQAVLEPADGSEASGRAIFGRLGKDEIVLQVVAEDLEPSASGDSYTVWLYRSPKLALRVGAVKVGDSGQLGARFPIPAELLAYVASGAFDQVYVSRSSDAAYKAEVARAREQETLPSYTGETVLTGQITGPIAKAAAGQGN